MVLPILVLKNYLGRNLTLNKGLKFESPQNLNKFQTFIDVKKYTRKLNIKIYLFSNPARQLTLLFNPPENLAPNVNDFRDLVTKDLANWRTKLVQPQHDFRVGMETLCNRKDR